MVQISFPGLGIGTFTINKVAFSFLGISVRWYGIILTCAIIVGFLYAYKRSSFEGISKDDVLDYAIYTVIFAIIGARAYYVLTTLNQFEYDSFIDVIAIWNGGIAIYGAVIAGAITVFIVSKIKKIKVTKALDMVAPGVMLAQAIGRWGNFANGEAHGTETELFCRMGLMHDGWSRMYYVHPTFLYESLWNLIGFLLINAFYKRKKYDGQIVLMYAAWYGFGRMFIEGLRTDSLYIGGTIRISQLVGFLCFVIGGILLIVFGIKARKAKLAEGEYQSVYNLSDKEKTETVSEVKTEETEEIKEDEKTTDDSAQNAEEKVETEEKDNGKID